VADAADRDGILDDHRRLIDRANAENRDLRLIDHRRADKTAETAEVGDREGAAGNLVRLELPGAGEAREIHTRELETEDILLVRIADHGNDQPVLQRDRDPDIDFVVIDDVVIIERRVEQRILPEAGYRRARDERQVGQREAVVGLELPLEAIAHLRDL